MYRIMVEECRNGKKQSRMQGIPHPFRREKTIASEKCRISALSSADFCLHNREDIAWGRVCWQGNKKEICRLFEAEQLNSKGLDQLDDHQDYTVIFWKPCAAGCA